MAMIGSMRDFVDICCILQTINRAPERGYSELSGWPSRENLHLAFIILADAHVLLRQWERDGVTTHRRTEMTLCN